MSIVLNLVSPSASWIMSDGLAINKETGEKVSGSLKKFQMLHSRLCMAYTGVLEVSSTLADNLCNLCPNIESATVETAAIYSREILKQFPREIAKTTQFLFTGISDNGRLATVTLKGDLSIELLEPAQSELKFAVLYHEECGDFIQNIIDFLHTGLQMDDAVRRGMTKTIHQVSLLDHSVNETTFFRIIR